jgi:hypothetical protein
MVITPHPHMKIQRHHIGREGAPLLVIDDLVADPDRLVRKASRAHFAPLGAYFPGIRAAAPLSYAAFLETTLRPLAAEVFGIHAERFTFPLCHYSLVTTPPEALGDLQRIPHVDATDPNGLATVHYLFRGPWGGTAFYRHRDTGYETIDTQRGERYFNRLAEEQRGASVASTGYINGDNEQFEQIERVEARFNRLVVYRRNSLHSGSIDNADVPGADVASGRLSINSFMVSVC